MRLSVIIAAVVMTAAACNSEQVQEQPAEPSPVTFDGALVAEASAQIAHGSRLADVLGCRGCHGNDLRGTNFTKDQPQYGPLYASNLTLVLRTYSDADIERVLRQGVHPIRGDLWGMPSDMFQHLADADLRALILYLRSLPPGGQLTPPPEFSALDRKEIASGKYKPTAQIIAETEAQMPLELGPKYTLGRYVAMTACTECHGSKLEGQGKNPDLIVAGAYSREQFERLMITGVPLDGRKLRMMDGVARGRFSKLTPRERDALYAYLRARAERPQ